MRKNKVWFVTGASKGLGLATVKKLLEQDYKVAATSRSVEELMKAVGQHDNFLPMQLDVLNETDIKQVIELTVERFGSLDVIFNNAGYGQVGPFEEISDELARKNFDANVFGTFNVIRNALPQLRKQQYGHIINISSIGGYVGFPASTIYAAAKFAIDGMSESITHELQPLGIHVTSLKPGGFRTNFLSPGSLFWSDRDPIEDYDQIRQNTQANLGKNDKNQGGDPNKFAELLIRISKEDQPPLHLFIGTDAYKLATSKIENIQKEMDTWRVIATSTGFDE
ncbi:NAD(P)-dependent dehydrogenase (short-subunit alcohol dehydrogenase family) [Paenibacillus phyllosphaerae]|uniref:NAD(P)-dependent dehydrogenase (Short-subunit alcohol dehydrogenase family) n=1 Tax=Paenibacillus phyllosphaerae TaxID=274593 RepID=A0A7W5FPE3_9BACL|nr:SDR family oxidoreductase [Paenibacillus phyllosphaerae]MBB3112137.1 NAD(P)-dependent dehydrogenase (short-subunit alcohol dehydrogenase family) [Paenibacillus phyllosphaerae]